MRGRDDAGQVLPLMVLVLVLAVGVAIVLGQVGARANARAQARTAADAAALAGAAEGEAAAANLAGANGATLEAYEVDGAAVRVVVAVGDVRASARAERTDAPVPTTYSGDDARGPARRAVDAPGAP